MDGRERTADPGDTFVIPTGSRFSFRNLDPAAPLRFLCYTSPPWPGPQEAVLEG